MDSPTLSFSSESVGHLLEDRWLEVPPYQRPYAWEQEHVAEFWTDLEQARDDDRQYFLGAVVLSRNGDRFQVIDGQQRLATATLLLAAIRDELVALGEEALAQHVERQYLVRFNPSTRLVEPRLYVAPADCGFFEQRFLLRSGGEPTSSSQRRLTAAFDYLRSAVSATSMDSAGLMDWVAHLAQSVLVVLVEAASEADAFQIFETLNDRGAPLTIADLLKNYLLSLRPESPEAIADAWDSAAVNLGQEAETQDFVTFIRHYWSSLKGATRERDLYRSLRRSITEPAAATTFARDMGTASEQYAALLDSSHPFWAEARTAPRGVDTLLYLQLGQYRPLLLAALEHLDAAEVDTLTEALVCWTVRGLIVGGIGGGTTERAYASAGVNIRAGKLKSTADIFNQLRPIIATDDDFRTAMETVSVPRVRFGQYLMRSLNRAMEGKAHPALEFSGMEEPTRALTHVLPKRADPTAWSSFAAADLGSYVNRLGNLALRPAGRAMGPAGWFERREWLTLFDLPVNDQLSQVEVWSPDAIRHRQQDLAAIALAVWPRSGQVL